MTQYRMMIGAFIRAIVSAAPTCTLWVYDTYSSAYVFRFYRRLRLTDLWTLIQPKKSERYRPWLIDREGVTYLPERKIVLKAKR